MNNRIAIIALAVVTLLFATATLSACNTIAGAGQDMSDAGKNIKRDADKASP